MLSVFAPITSDFKVKGYVVIHCPMSSIQNSTNSLLNISYIMLIILFLLSLIILIFFTEMVYIPLRKITERAFRNSRVEVLDDDFVFYIDWSSRIEHHTSGRVDDPDDGIQIFCCL